MPWVRFDDQFPIHRKVDGLSDAAYRLHTSAIFWCARNLTDGFLSEEDLDGVVSARVRTPARFAAECVKREVWHLAGDDCPSELCPAPVPKEGWVIHDYWEFQPSKARVVRDRKKSAQRQANWRAKHNGSSNGVTNAVSERAPPRPPLKGAGVGARATREGADAHPPPLPAADLHPYKPDGHGTCEICEFPEANRRHDQGEP